MPNPIADLTLLTLPSDLRKAAATLGADEARYLVDLYYQAQDFRIASAGQVRSLSASEEPHGTISFIQDQFRLIEKQIHGALDVYSNSQPIGRWSREHTGVGPVIAAGLMAHIDIEKAPTVGHIWRFAGLDDPANYQWGKGQKRPWNAKLKTLCWKLGDSFVKFSGHQKCFYGHIYVARKQFEVERDESGGNADAAKRKLETTNIKDAETRRIYEAGHLPAGRLDLRARRYAVKLFLSAWHEQAYREAYGTEPPLPYPIAHLGHAHKINSPV